jgi:NitT/TauT family transport system substrate-binding protein
MKYRISGAVALVAAVALLSACSGGGATPSSSADAGSGSGDAAGSGELTKLSVSVSPSASTSVPMYLGIEKGFFAEHGLDVTLSVLTNGTVAIPQVVSGQNQFSAASFAPVIEAVKQGLPIKVVGVANVIPTTESQFQGFIVREDYQGDTLADAKTIAAQSALLDPVQADNVEKFGGDYDAMQILQVPLPAIADAVKSGSADTALLNQPFLAQALATPGIRLLGYVGLDQSLPGTPGAVYIGEEGYMKANPDVTAAFQAAVLESYAYAQNNLEEAAEFVPNTGLSDSVPDLVSMPEYAAETVTAAKFDELLDLFAKYGQNPDGLKAADILYAGN